MGGARGCAFGVKASPQVLPGRHSNMFRLMVSRIVGAVLIVLATCLAYVGIGIAVPMIGFLEGEEDWLGPEPEMLIPIAALYVAALLCWLGARLWRRKSEEVSHLNTSVPGRETTRFRATK